jgi:hypothetical protein
MNNKLNRRAFFGSLLIIPSLFKGLRHNRLEFYAHQTCGYAIIDRRWVITDDMANNIIFKAIPLEKLVG